LGYSSMTMSRAFDELEAAELGKSSPLGRERLLRLEEPKREIWAKAQSFLRNPVKKRRNIRPMQHKLPGPRAGLSALPRYSMLAEPENTVVALSQEAWKSLQQREAVVKVAVHDPDVLNVEIWSYAPTLFAGDVVDPLSLYLSLRGAKDERVEAAIEHMIEDVKW
ncbi:MAG: transcriptional regulator, partial [Actinomycetia bacterium]|nr:transcriptional regulator [Actinomycetes bacterium]